MKNYILFLPPEEVASIKARLWDNKQAKIYFDWFISIKDDRVEYLLTWIDEKLTGDNEADIDRIGRKVMDIIRKVPLFEVNNDQITIINSGLALIADLSLLISKLIMQKHPSIVWKIVKRPKNDISYNMPALFGFPLIGHLELMRGSITEAKAILRGDKTNAIWGDIYRYAINLIN